MHLFPLLSDRPLQTPQQRLRQAVLLSFCDPLPPQFYLLEQLSLRQWQALLPWLDISGLALYFYDRLSDLDLLDWVPAEIKSRLQNNLADNTERMRSMLAESIEIQDHFQRSGIGYLLLKGFSLMPLSVPRPELRSQLDLDFLVTIDAVEPARRILEERGFILHAISGRSWEFKTPHTHNGSLRNLYKNHPARSIELHVEAHPHQEGSHVRDREWRNICGFNMPVLPSVPLFLGQAAHLYKHVSTGFFRCSHLLELYRHIVAKYSNADFWIQVQEAIAQDDKLVLPLGVTTLLLTHVMGPFAPEPLTRFTERLGAPVQMWTERIGPRCVYSNWPGTKLHLLLQRELVDGDASKQSSLRRALLPRSLPPPIAHAPVGETISARILRLVRQASYILFRLRYHTTTGLQYGWELARWKKQIRLLKEHQIVSTPAISDDSLATDISETNKGMTIL